MVIPPRIILDATWMAWRLGLLRPRPRPAEADPEAPARYTTCVLRLPPEAAGLLHRIALELVASESGVHVYPRESIHLTVVQGARRRLDVDRVLTGVSAVAPTVPGARVRLIGLGMSRQSVFAAFEVDRTLRLTRANLSRTWGGTNIARRLAGGLWHANILRFELEPSARLCDAVRARRHVQRGPWDADSLEVLRTNRVLGPDQTTVLARYPLR